MKTVERPKLKLQMALASCLGLLVFSCQQASNDKTGLAALLSSGQVTGGTEQAGFEAQAGGGGGGQQPPPSPWVGIKNLRDKGVVETGFVIGTAGYSGFYLPQNPPPEITLVEVSLNGGVTYQSTSGPAYAWTFKLPTGANTWKQGSLHSIWVRSKASDGKYSSVQKINVRKGNNKDINGDGYADVVSGATPYPFKGAIYVYHSSGKVGVLGTATELASTTITGESVHDLFGASITTADVNGDGYADIIASASKFNSGGGRLYVFHSSGSAGITITTAAAASSIINGATAQNCCAEFGKSVSAGDINGDGYADIVVTGVWSSTVHIFHSSGSAGVTANNASLASTIIQGNPPGALFSAVVGDVNGDGYADIAVSGGGSVYVFHSSGTISGITTTSIALANTIIPTGSNQHLAMGDLTGDGFADLVVSSENVRAVSVFHSSGTNSGIPNEAPASTTIVGDPSDGNFGYSLATGDVNGDGYADLIVGQPDNIQSRVYIFESTAVGVGVSKSANASTIIECQTCGQFGHSLSARDVNGDGFSDVVVGDFALATYIFHSIGGAGFPLTLDAQGASAIITSDTIYSFGASVAERVAAPPTAFVVELTFVVKKDEEAPLFRRAA